MKRGEGWKRREGEGRERMGKAGICLCSWVMDAPDPMYTVGHNCLTPQVSTVTIRRQ